jgi:hypothetical protein
MTINAVCRGQWQRRTGSTFALTEKIILQLQSCEAHSRLTAFKEIAEMLSSFTGLQHQANTRELSGSAQALRVCSVTPRCTRL